MKNTTRRKVLGGLGTLGASALVAPGFAQSPSEIVVTSYGGVFETALRDTFIADFTKKTGVQAKVQLGGPSQWVGQVEANQASPPIHVIIGNTDIIIDAGERGLLEKPDASKVPNMKDVPQSFVDLCGGWGVAFDYGTVGLAYHRGRIKNPPRSLAEFVDRTAKGEWTASMPSISFSQITFYTIWNLADALGGGLTNIDPAIDAAKRMQKHTVFWSSITDFLNHLQSGEADIGVYTDGRTWAHYDTGATWIDFINPTEGGVMTPIGVCKPKNAPQVAWKYIDSMLAPEPQAVFAELVNYGVTNSKVKYSDKVKGRITPFEKTRLVPLDMAKYVPGWIERWNKEIGA
jgi:putative spermidine/putrescine transport system substrate-binding protein